MRTRITLACTECKQRNYNTTKDKKAHPERMETKKYCMFCKSHTLQKETKYSLQRGGIMAETTEKKAKKSLLKSLKGEFKKIIWPSKKELAKQTAAVTVCSLVLGIIIAIVDAIIQYGIDFIVK